MIALPQNIKKLFGIKSDISGIMNNFSWLMIDKIIKIIFGLIVNLILIRILGPDKYGHYTYLIAYVLIFSPLISLGIDSIIIRDLINNPEKERNILETSFFMKLIGSITSIMILFSYCVMIKMNPREIILLLIAGLGLICQAFDVIDYSFQAKLMAKQSVISRSVSFIVVNIIKVAAIIYYQSIEALFILFSLEYLITAFLYSGFYKLDFSLFKIDKQYLQRLITNGWPLFILNITIIIQTYFDQLFIGKSLGTIELGNYSVALLMVNTLSFIPVIICNSVMPEIVDSRIKNEHLYQLKMTQVYRITLIFSLCCFIMYFIFPRTIISLLFGNKYHTAGVLLMWMSLKLFFVSIAVIRQMFITNENLFRFQLISSLSGILLYVISMFVLVPAIGSIGAVISYYFSLFVGIFIIDLFHPKLRKNLLFISHALDFRYFFRKDGKD